MCVLFVLLRSVEHWCHNARSGSDGDASQFLFLSAGYHRELLLPVRHLVFSEFLHESLSFLLHFTRSPLFRCSPWVSAVSLVSNCLSQFLTCSLLFCSLPFAHFSGFPHGVPHFLRFLLHPVVACSQLSFPFFSDVQWSSLFYLFQCLVLPHLLVSCLQRAPEADVKTLSSHQHDPFVLAAQPGDTIVEPRRQVGRNET